METEIRQYIELLKKRLANLRLLAKELLDCRDSFVHRDLEAIDQHITSQNTLCLEIRVLDHELKSVKQRLAAGFGLDSMTMDDAALEARCDANYARELQEVLDNLAAVRNSVRRLNQVYAGMLVRSRHTINTQINIMASHAGVYGPRGRRVWPLP